MAGVIVEPAQNNIITDVMPLEILETKKVFTEARDPSTYRKIERPVMKLTGVFQRGDELNANSRIYPTSVLEEAVVSLQDNIQRRCVFGEYDHPADAKIHLDRVCVLITNVKMDGNRVIGEAEVLEDTQWGQALKGIILQGGLLGVSSRGVGDMKTVFNEGRETYEVLPGYKIVTWDVVAEPSVTGCDLTVMESKQKEAKVIKESRHKKHLEYQILQELKNSLL